MTDMAASTCLKDILSVPRGVKSMSQGGQNEGETSSPRVSPSFIGYQTRLPAFVGVNPCIPKLIFRPDYQIARADKQPIGSSHGLFGSQSPFYSVFLLTFSHQSFSVGRTTEKAYSFSPTKSFRWQGN